MRDRSGAAHEDFKEIAMQRSGVSGLPRWYIVIIHSLPIERWVVDDEAIRERDREPQGLHRSGSKLGPLRDRLSAVRIVTGATPRIHQLEQERRRPSLLLPLLGDSFL